MTTTGQWRHRFSAWLPTFESRSCSSRPSARKVGPRAPRGRTAEARRSPRPPARAPPRAAVGQGKLALRLAAGSTSADLLSELTRQYPTLANVLPSCALSVNRQYLSSEQVGCRAANVRPSRGRLLRRGAPCARSAAPSARRHSRVGRLGRRRRGRGDSAGERRLAGAFTIESCWRPTTARRGRGTVLRGSSYGLRADCATGFCTREDKRRETRYPPFPACRMSLEGEFSSGGELRYGKDATYITPSCCPS